MWNAKYGELQEQYSPLDTIGRQKYLLMWLLWGDLEVIALTCDTSSSECHTPSTRQSPLELSTTCLCRGGIPSQDWSRMTMACPHLSSSPAHASFRTQWHPTSLLGPWRTHTHMYMHMYIYIYTSVVRNTDKGKILWGLTGHGERLGCYSKQDRMSLEGFKYREMVWFTVYQSVLVSGTRLHYVCTGGGTGMGRRQFRKL